MSTAETATTPGESSGTDEPTRAEYCVISCADIFAGAGEIMASPMAPTPLLGARLARLTTEPDLLITDGGTTPLAIAGVMGGATSEVDDTTTDVLVEAAHFGSACVELVDRFAVGSHRKGKVF